MQAIKTCGYWTVFDKTTRMGARKHLMHLCQCKCGTWSFVNAYTLDNGITKSCGCFRTENTIARCTKHGRCGTRLYNIWHSMHLRCNEPSHGTYKHYGGRGITIDPRWYDIENFAADMGDPGPTLELDRIDTNGPYTKANCRWTTRSINMSNLRDSYTLNGHKISVGQAAKLLGMPRATLSNRMWIKNETLQEAVEHYKPGFIYEPTKS